MILDPNITDTRIKRRFKTLEADLNEIWGDMLDFTDSVYSGGRLQITAMCNSHNGLFTTRCDSLLSGHGCGFCANLKRSINLQNLTAKKAKMAKLEFVDKVYAIFGDLYDLSEVDYVNSTTKVEIWCNTHNEFFSITPSDLLSGRGCMKCGRVRTIEFNKKDPIAAINDLKKIVSPTLNLKNFVYKGCKEKSEVTCLICQNVFLITPGDLISGYGCRPCGLSEGAIKRIESSAKKIDARIFETHGKKLKRVSPYKGMLIHIDVLCQGCGLISKISPDNLVRGRGCPNCASYGFNPLKRGSLYYFKYQIGDVVAWKIGITNRTVEERYGKSDLSNITIIKIWEYELGKDAYDEEQRLLKLHKEFQYTGDPLLDSGGNTELFYKDVLGLDLEYQA